MGSQTAPAAGAAVASEVSPPTTPVAATACDHRHRDGVVSSEPIPIITIKAPLSSAHAAAVDIKPALNVITDHGTNHDDDGEKNLRHPIIVPGGSPDEDDGGDLIPDSMASRIQSDNVDDDDDLVPDSMASRITNLPGFVARRLTPDPESRKQHHQKQQQTARY